MKRLAALGLLLALPATALPATALAQPVGPDEPPEVVSPDDIQRPPPTPRPGPVTSPKPKPPEEPAEPEEPEEPDETELGEAGETCQKRADCRDGLKCVAETCTDPDAEPAPKPKPEPEPEPDSDDAWSSYVIGEGTQPFVGLSFAPGFSVYHNLLSGNVGDVDPAINFALRGGVLIDGIELALELSPVTFVGFLDSFGDPMLQVTATGGTYLHLTEDLVWPLRAGIGFLAINTPPPADLLFELRADLIGIGYQVGHLMLELNAPSYRFATEFDRVGTHHWLFSLGATYVF